MKPLPPKRYTPETTDEERRGLRELLKNTNVSSPHLEIGTAAGAILAELMTCYIDNNRPNFVVVDPFTYFENQLDTVRENLSRFGIDHSTVDFREGTSSEFYRLAVQNKETFGFIFIDGNHKIKFVVQDLCWTGLLEDGGYVCLHDYSPLHPGVVLAVDRFLQKNQNYSMVSKYDSLIILRKNRPSTQCEIGVWDHLWAFLNSILLHWQNIFRKRFRKAGS